MEKKSASHGCLLVGWDEVLIPDVVSGLELELREEERGAQKYVFDSVLDIKIPRVE